MSCRRVLLTLVVAALVAGPVLAQPPGGGRGQGRGMGFGGANQMTLLNDKGIQTELKMSEEQVNNVRALGEKQREMMQGLRDMEQEERREKMRENQRKITEELNKILNDGQQKRLKQLMFQASTRQVGLSMWLMNPENQRALEISDEQRETLRAIQEESREAMGEIFQGGGGGGGRGQLSPEMRAKMDELRKSTDGKIEKVLTDAQKAKLKDMGGEPYKGEFPTGGPRRGGGN
jgi:Spy/CpxP family protein refolding chaperone